MISMETPQNMKPTKAASGRRDLFVPNPKLKLLDQMREVCRLRHFSLRTEQTYVAWARRFLAFCRDHPQPHARSVE